MSKTKTWEEGFYEGGLCALKVLYGHNGNIDTDYREVVRCFGIEGLKKAAMEEHDLESSGLLEYLKSENL